MFQLTKSSEYAILFLTKLIGANKKKPLNLVSISRENSLPYKFLSRIVLELKKAKLIISKEGIKGGYFLAKQPDRINLMEIIQAVEGKRGLVNCVYGKCHLDKHCGHQQIWLNLQKKINLELENIKLSDLIDINPKS